MAGLGKHWPLLIDGEPVEPAEKLTSVNPARPERGRSARSATAARPRRSGPWTPPAPPSPAWRDTPARERAAVLFRAAELMRGELFELAALEVFEAGKTWREADADVGEADRLPRVLRPRDAPSRRAAAHGRRARRAEPLLLPAARRRRRHRPLELPPGHPHGHDQRRPGRRQRRHREAGRSHAGDRRPAGAHPARGGSARRARSTSSPAPAARSATCWCATPTST